MVPNWPILNALSALRGAKKLLNVGSKMGSFHLFVHLDPFFVPNQPILKAFWILGKPKWATMSSKRAENTCLGIVCGP